MRHGLIIGTLALLQGPLFAVQPHQAPRLKDSNFKGAGVLPMYDFHGETYVILARERGGYDKGTWDSFSGSRDPGEQHPSKSAARECEEESKGLLSNYLDLDSKRTKIISKRRPKDNTSFVIYITPLSNKFSFKAFASKFHAKKTYGKYDEKDALAIVKLSYFQKAIATARKDNKTHRFDNIALFAKVYDKDKDIVKDHIITLRPSLVWCLQDYYKGTKKGIQGKDKRALFY